MSALRARAEEYLAMRRALGFGLTTQGRHLMSFVRFCEERSAGRVTADLAVEWATQASRGSGDEVYQARKLDTVRIFARHLKPLDPATEVPPGDVLSRRQGRVPPYLYSPQEIAALMSAAGDLTPAMRAMTWRTLIGLLAVTGMRQGEACRLERDDVDLDAGTLVIADSKFGKSRQVFLHPSAAVAMRAYEQARNQAFPGPETAAFLVNSRGRPLNGHNLPHTFAPLAAAAGIQAPPGRRPPRLHDLRHVFTVATMLDWYRDGGDVQARLPLLSTWLGHVDPKSTYWYLQATGTSRPSPSSSPWQRGGSSRQGDSPVTDLAPILQGFFTAQVYLHADMTIKEQALARVQQPRTSPGRYRPPDTLLAFLDSL